MNELEIFIRMTLFGLGLILSLLTLASFVRVKEIKIAFAALGFCVLALEGAILVAGIFASGIESCISIAFLAGANLIALVFFYLSIIKK